MHPRSPRPSLFRRAFRPAWEDLPRAVFEAGEEGGVALDRDQARMWALVLTARHVPHRLMRAGEGSTIQVQRWFLERAVREIRLWRVENPPGAEGVPMPALPTRPAELWPTVAFMLGLLAFFSFAGHAARLAGVSAHQLVNLGSANAGAILDGQWWRLVTALTLHGDSAHVVGNAIIGGAFMVILAQRTGSGLALVLAVASGAAGNLLNAFVQGAPHDSIGFSTAVFGVAGVLAGVRITDGVRHDTGRFAGAVLPVAAGLGILAMLGAGGENTDLGAHLFGFVVGVPMGYVAGAALAVLGFPSRVAGAVLYGVSLAAFVWAWGLALST